MLNVSDLSIMRGGQIVISQLNLALKPGRALILKGANGCGKTTLLRCLSGLIPPQSGTIEIGDEDSVYAGHADGLKAMLSVSENLRFWADIYKPQNPGHRLEEAIEAFNLKRLRQRRGAELSAGQKRRAGLARLLVSGRALWLLDEPTVSLDQASVTRLAAVIEQHLAQGGSAIIASHLALGIEAETFDLEIHNQRSNASPRAAQHIEGFAW